MSAEPKGQYFSHSNFAKSSAHSKLGRFSVTPGNPSSQTEKLKLERAAGIEPASSAWKAEVIAIIRCPHLVPTTGIELVTY